MGPTTEPPLRSVLQKAPSITKSTTYQIYSIGDMTLFLLGRVFIFLLVALVNGRPAALPYYQDHYLTSRLKSRLKLRRTRLGGKQDTLANDEGAQQGNAKLKPTTESTMIAMVRTLQFQIRCQSAKVVIRRKRILDLLSGDSFETIASKIMVAAVVRERQTAFHLTAPKLPTFLGSLQLYFLLRFSNLPI
jgi:hypothetical protein